MSSSYRTEKLISNRCRNCNRESCAPDNFCRWCGFHQKFGLIDASGSEGSQERKTTVLGNSEQTPRSLSKQSLNTLKKGVVAKTGPLRLTPFGAFVIAVLIAIPMWLLIILLSPFDAYVSAKSAWSEIVVR